MNGELRLKQLLYRVNIYFLWDLGENEFWVTLFTEDKMLLNTYMVVMEKGLVYTVNKEGKENKCIRNA